MSDPQTAYFKGEFRPLSEATVSIRSKALNYGLGCFEGIRAYWNDEHEQLYVFRLRDHFVRMHRSMRILNMPRDRSVEEMCEITLELLRRNDMRRHCYIRPLAIVNSERMSPEFVPEDCKFGVYVLPLADYLDTSKGITVRVSSWQRVSDNMIPASAKPTAAYLNSALARMEAKQAGADEAVFLNAQGYVSEGSAEHIFLVRDGVVASPLPQDDNLYGITRDTLITLCRRELGIEVESRHVRRSELYMADEVLLCGSGAQVVPVREVDGRPVGDGKPGPLTLQLQALYFRVVNGNFEPYADWCTPVYPT